jgi:hypothetical protein
MATITAVEKSFRFTLGSAQLDCLSQKEIPFMKYRGGYIVEGQHYDGVLDCLGVTNDEVDLTNTETDGLIDVRITPVPREDVTIESWDGTHVDWYRTRIIEIFSKLHEAFGKKIRIYVPHGQCSDIVSGDPDHFNVKIWSSPDGDHNVDTPRQVYELYVSCHDSGSFLPTGLGEVIYADDYAVAEVFNNDLYIHHDLVHSDDAHSLEIAEIIVEKAISARERYIENSGREFRVIANRLSSPFAQNVIDVINKENLAEELGKHIVISDITRPYVDNGILQGDRLELSFTLSGTTGNYKDFSADKIMGYKVQDTNKLIPNNAVFDQGILNDTSDEIIAQVTGDNLQFLVYNILSRQSRLVVKIINEYQRILAMSEEEREAYNDRVREVIQKGSVDAFIKVLADSRNDMLRDQKSKITSLRSDIETRQKEIIDMTRSLSQNMASVEALEKDETWVHEKIHKEMTAMRRNKSVLRVEVVGDKVHALTKVLYCKDPRTDKWHEIGAFNITMNLRMGSGDMVTYRNLTRRVDAYESGMQAPHVFPRGNPCLGSISSTLPELIGQCEFSVALDLSIQFLQQVNTADVAGKHVDKWPIAEDYNGGK